MAVSQYLCASLCMAQEKPAVLYSGTFERFQKRGNPWAGVDEQSFIRTFEARAPIVTNEGATVNEAVPCTPNIVDLNGDGLLDLVVVDARGLTWFYANHGSRTEPKFSSAEIVPLMLSNGQAQCPGMDVVSFDDGGAYSLVYGDWLGQIFYAPNTGNKTSPRFTQPKDSADYLVKTTYKGNLWGNFFSPAVYDWDQDGRKDLIIGEGTYSANSIWLFLNQGTNGQPVFNEKKRLPLVRGLGREHLTPVVLDWNEDGKPDIITGEREGYISVYLNESTGEEYKFREPFKIRIGNQDKFGNLTRFKFGDLNGDGLPDLAIGRTNGRIGLALNRGTKGNPQFSEIRDITGVNPFPPYAQPVGVNFFAPVRSTYHILRVVSNNKADGLTYEEGFQPPPGSKGNYSLKLEFCQPRTTYFNGIIPFVWDETDGSGNLFIINPRERFKIVTNKNYTISFWMRASGFKRLRWNIHGAETIVTGKDEDGLNVTGSLHYGAEREFTNSNEWVNVRGTIRFDRKPGVKEDREIQASLDIICEDKGTLYLDDLTLTEGDIPF